MTSSGRLGSLGERSVAASGGELPEILRALSKQKRTGTLKVADGTGRAKYVYFNNGEIDFLKSRKGRTLIGRALLKRRKIEEPDLVRALKRHATTGEKLGKCCVALGLCREEDVREALAFQAIEEVTDLLTWKGARSEFHRGEPPLDIFDFDDLAVRMRLSPDALVRESERRAGDLEQVRRAIPSMADIYAPSPEAVYGMRAPAPGSADAELLRLLDGVRDVDEVLESVRLSDLEALRALDRLVRAGEVAPLAPNQLFAAASEHEKDGNLERAHRLYLRAEETGFDQLDLSNRIAKIADALGRRDEAVARFLEFADRCAREELPEAAVAAYRKALEVDPGAREAMEKLTATLVQLDKGGEAVGMLKQLARRYDRDQERDKIHRAWMEVLRLSPEDADAHRALAEGYLLAGDKVQAIIELEELAAIVLSRGESDQGIAVLKEILAIDPECVEAHLELAATYTNLARAQEAVLEYERLAESLSRTGISGAGEGMNWQFLIDINEKIISLAPENRRARQWLAQAYGQKAEVDKAVAHYEGLVATLERERAPPEELAQALRQYAALRPDDFTARERLGNALAAAGRKDEALAVLREAAEAALKAHKIDVSRRASEAVARLAPYDLDAHRTLGRLAEIERDEGRASAKWRDVAELARAAGLLDEAVEAAEKALELGKDADARRLVAAAREAKGQRPEAARALVEAAREDLAEENFGRAKKAAERALALDPGAAGAQDVLFAVEGRRAAAQKAASGHSRIGAAPEKPPSKPTITGGSPDATIIDRPRRKYGSVTGVAEKLRAIKDPGASGMFGRAALAAGHGEQATPAPEPPKKTLGAAAKLKAFKGGGGLAAALGGGAAAPAPEPPAPEPAPAPELALVPVPDASAPAPAGPPAFPPSDPVPVAQPAKKAISAADRLKRLKGGGGDAPATAPAASGPAAAAAAPADAALAEKLQKAEQGEVQEGAAKKAMSAAAKLKALGKR